MSKSSSNKLSFFKNLIILCFGTVLPKFATIITLPIITGCLTKEENGTYDLINTMISLLLPLVTLQIQAAAFRYLIECRGKKDEENQLISSVFWFVILTTAIADVIFYFALYQYSVKMRLVIIVYFTLEKIFRIVQQIARGIGQNKVYSTSCVIESLLNMLLIIYMLSIMNKGLMGVLFSVCVAEFISIIYVMIRTNFVKRLSVGIDWSIIKKMLAYAIPLVPNVISIWILSSSDRFVIKYFIGIEAVSVYSVANKIPFVLNTFQSAFSQAWQENASISIKDDDMDAYYSEMFDMTTTLIAGLMAMILMCLPILFRLLIKGDYSESYIHITILSMAAYFSCLMSFLGGIYVAHKKTKSIGVTTIVSAIINLVINLSLINLIGLYAASISTLVAYLVIVIFRMKDLTKFQKMTYNYKKLIAMVIMLSMMCWLSSCRNIQTDLINVALGIVFIFIFNRKNVINLINMFLKKKNNKEV